MMEKFYPDEYLDSTYEIDFDELYAQGYRGVIFDIDNTFKRTGICVYAVVKQQGTACENV